MLGTDALSCILQEPGVFIFFLILLDTKGANYSGQYRSLTVSAFDSKDRAAPDYLRGICWKLVGWPLAPLETYQILARGHVIKGSLTRISYNTHSEFDVVAHLLNEGGLSVKCEVSVMQVIGVGWARQNPPPY